mmetsp:Transcript_14375/g.13959  ORF Transcript_14375/g.13959 Transcript_14375/m.13959 type:complete len:85 (+) Transcript_14375:622-876(+)
MELTPTQKVVETYQEVISEVLKMFALEKYVNKKKQELDQIQEKKKEIEKFKTFVPKFNNQQMNPVPQPNMVNQGPINMNPQNMP